MESEFFDSYVEIILFFFFNFFYLFMIFRERERERGRDIGRGRSRLYALGARRGIQSRVSRIAPWAKGRRQTAAPPRDPVNKYFYQKGNTWDPWVAQRFSACLWPRAQSWRPGIESHIRLPVHGACFSLCLCLCLSLSLFV